MTLPPETIATAIDQAHLNVGLRGIDWLASEGNISITFDNGDVTLFDYVDGQDYEAHFLYVSRGREAIDHAKQAFHTMFTKHGARLIFGLVPDFNRKMKLVARWAGAKSAGMRPTPYGPCELFVVSDNMWKGLNS